jgi:hypothetical protein
VNGANIASSGIDNNDGTWWQASSSADPQRYVVDFGVPVNVNVFRILTLMTSATFNVDYGSDGTTWTTAWTATGAQTPGHIPPCRQFFPNPNCTVGRKHLWRLSVTLNESNLTTQIAALEMRGVAGGPNKINIATDKFWVNGGPTGGTSPEKMFDGNAATHWDTANANGGIFIWEVPGSVDIVELVMQASVIPSRAPKSFTLAYSADGIVWITVITVTNGANWTAGEIRTYTNTGTSYDLVGGKGDRTGLVTITGTTTVGAGNHAMLANGTYNNEYWWSGGSSGTMRADFGVGASKVCDEYSWNQDVGVSHGVWKAGGSNDGVTVTLFPETFNLGDVNGTDIIPFTNSTGYRYYHLVQQSGSYVSTPYIREWEFKLKDAGVPVPLPAGPLDGLAPTFAASMSRYLLKTFGTGPRHAAVVPEVSAWYDQTGVSRHYINNTSGARPIVAAAGPNSRLCLDFDGVNDRLNGVAWQTLVTSTAKFVIVSAILDTISVATDLTFFSGGHWLWGDDGGIVMLNASVDASTKKVYAAQYYGGPSSQKVGTAVTEGTVYVFTLRHESGTWYLGVNGVEASTPGSTTYTGSNNATSVGGHASVFLDGKIFELATFNVVPSAPQRAALIADFMAHVGAV